MTPRQRWLALLTSQKPDKIPTDIWATKEVMDSLKHYFKVSNNDDLYDSIGIDGITKIEPPLKSEFIPKEPNVDIYGIHRKYVNYGAGVYDEFEKFPLATFTTVEEIENYPWPKADWHDFDAFKYLIENASDYRIIKTGDFEPFLHYAALRGLEQAMIDFYEYPDLLNSALEKLFQYHYELNSRAFEIGKNKIELSFQAEDYGAQNGLMFSKELINEFFIPHQQKIAELAKNYGIYIIFHSDGDIFEIIPELIEKVHIDILNPIQWRCKSMDRKKLAENFGDKIIFHGAVDNQQTLPFGSVSDVQNEVLENIEIFKNVRWIAAPCHNIQPITPIENIIALYETVNNYRPF